LINKSEFSWKTKNCLDDPKLLNGSAYIIIYIYISRVQKKGGKKMKRVMDGGTGGEGGRWLRKEGTVRDKKRDKREWDGTQENKPVKDER